MKKILLLILVAALTSCGQPNSSEATIQNTSENAAETAPQSGESMSSGVDYVTYPTTVVDSPAAKFCESKGGKSFVEKREDGFEMLYCEVAGEKKDAWQFMNDNA